MSSGTYTTLEFDHKTSCVIAYTRCYKLVRYYITELESKNETLSFLFCAVGK